MAERGFFQGYTWVTWLVVSQVSAGGLLVGLIMKYADNVVKGFATSLSIILSSLVSWWLPAFGFSPTAAFLGGSALVMLATIMYSSQAADPARLAPSERTHEPHAAPAAAGGSSGGGVGAAGGARRHPRAAVDPKAEFMLFSSTLTDRVRHANSAKGEHLHAV